jgi:phosphoadenosine phosphosulfate reductase
VRGVSGLGGPPLGRPGAPEPSPAPPGRAPLGFDLAAESARLEASSPAERLAFALDAFGDDLLFTSSFGAGSGVLLHLWSLVAPGRPVVFLDTGFHFDETLGYRDELTRLLGLRVEIARPAHTMAEFVVEHGPDIYLRDPDFCCARNKIDPIAPYRARARAWISGLRRDQSKERAQAPVLALEPDGLVKVHPLATMTAGEARAYLLEHGVPEHPLVKRRYLSIGCFPCTRPVADGEDERSGRWAGRAKTECGLHTRPSPS